MGINYLHDCLPLSFLLVLFDAKNSVKFSLHHKQTEAQTQEDKRQSAGLKTELCYNYATAMLLNKL